MTTSSGRGWGRRLGALAMVAAAALSPSAASADAAPYATYGSGLLAGASAASVDGSGTASVSYPLTLPPGRGGVQPMLGLRYSGGGGPSVVGVGWSLGLPAIERAGLAGGPPRFDSTDTYYFSGSRLVQVCVVSGTTCTAGGASAPMPHWATGWTLYRPAVDASYVRVFKSSGGVLWRVQQRSGEIWEFGAPSEGSNPDPQGGLDYSMSSLPFRWKLVRQFEAYTSGNSPKNIVRYSWRHDAAGVVLNVSTLADIYYSPPVTGAATEASFANHIHLTYSGANTFRTRYKVVDSPMWLREPEQVLARIDVASKGYQSSREQVRRYHLTYSYAIFDRAYLSGIVMEGRCTPNVQESPQPDRDFTTYMLPPVTNCPKYLPGTTYEYSPDAHYDSGIYNGGVLLGIELRAGEAAAPSPALAGRNVAIMDVNRDGLADLVQAAPLGASGPRVYMNGLDAVAGTRLTLGGPVTGSSGGALDDTTGISVPGYWNDWSSVTWLHRAPGGSPPGDGSPKALLELARTGAPGWNIGSWSALAPAAMPPPHVYGDIDGDGTTDMIYLDETTGAATPPTRVRFSRRMVNGPPGLIGRVTPFSELPPTGPYAYQTNLRLGTGSRAPRSAALADMNGDGIVDYVTTESTGWVYIPGRGDGLFGCTNPSGGCVTAVASPGLNDVTPASSLKEVELFGTAPDYPGGVGFQPTPLPPRTGNTSDERRVLPHLAFHDVTGDGRADLVYVSKAAGSGINLDVWVNRDGRQLHRARRLLPDGSFSLYVNAFTNPLPDETRLLFGDMNGDGIDDVVLCGDDQCAYSSYQSSKPGLLTAVHQEGGATTEFEYFQGLADVEQNQSIAGNPWASDGAWTTHAPSPIWPVKRTTTSNNAPGYYARTTTQDYDYRDPMYDRWRQSFRGFRRTRTTTGNLAVDTEFHFGGCLGVRDDAAATQVHGCADPELGGGWDALNGQPSIIERLDPSTGVYHSTVNNTYAAQASDPGVTFTYIAAVDTRLYDTNAFVPSSSSETNYTPFQTAYSVPVRASGGVVLRRRQTYDSAGNMTQAIDDGQVNGGTPIDRPIATTYEWTSTDTSWPAAVSALGREYRLKSVETKYLPGGAGPLLTASSGLDGTPRKIWFAYDQLGRLTNTSATLAGSLLLQRTHEGGLATAPEPAGSADGSVFLSLLSYDAYGNVIKRLGSTTGECQTFDFDPLFADLPRVAHRFLGASCTGTDLATTTVFDRGLGMVTQQSGFNNETQRVDTDAFGRPATTWGTAPAGTLVKETTFQYSPTDQAIHWVHATREAADPSNKGASRTFADSLGVPLATLVQADPSAGDGGDWTAQTTPLLSSRGEPLTWHEPTFHQGSPDTFSVGNSFGAERATAAYDFMSRRTDAWRSTDGHQTEHIQYSQLMTTVWDAQRLSLAAVQGTSTLRDGHGRTVRVTRPLELAEAGATMQTSTDYLATGETAVVERHGGAGTERYRRWMKYDSLGRLVENAEPNSALNFADLPAGAPALKTWRYRYDNAGRLVGTRDARGCGKNLFYDLANRLIAEDFSPCLSSQQAWTGPPDLTTGNATEAFYRYDSPESGQTTDYGNGLYLRGKLVSVRDRGAHTRYAYDARGRTVGVARRIAKPGATPSLLASRYTNYWFRTASTFDERDRLQRLETGADVPELQVGGSSHLDYHYTARNVLRSVDGTYGTLLADQRFAADGLLELATYGDAGQTQASYAYRQDRRLDSYTLHQGNIVAELPRDLIQHSFVYDEVGNIRSIADGRDETRWPAGSKPVSRTATYDALYRVTEINYAHSGDSYVSPFEAEESASNALPLPRVTPATGRRVENQSYGYDVLGNLTAATDDALTSFDRGLGQITSGSLAAPDPASRKPNQLLFANGPTPGGGVEAHYDAAGNLTDIAMERDGACSAPTGKCSQRLLYEWDEVGQLSRARRWDYTTMTGQLYPSLPLDPASAELRYQYAGGQRVIKQSVDTASSTSSYAVDVFDTLRLNHAAYSTSANDFERNAATETAYLPGLGSVIYAPGLPTAPGPTPDRHVLLNFGDHLGSTTAVVDAATGQLIEYATYLGYGALDSDYRPAEWQSFREAYKFTGKEEDIEVGLQYFGARYYSPYLARFISPDPLTIHGMGSDLNPYAYVGGRVFNATDPNGLCDSLWGCATEGWNAVFGDAPGKSNGSGSGGEGQGGTKQCETGDGACFRGPSGSAGSSGSSGSAPVPAKAPPPPPPLWVVAGVGAATGVAKAWLGPAANSPVTPTEYVNQLTKALGGPLVEATNALAVPVIVSAITDKPVQIDPTRVAAVAIDIGLGLLGARLAGAPALAAEAEAGGSMCFAAGTIVLMADGSTKRIEEVGEGDVVLADDPLTVRGPEPHKVTQIHRTATYRLVRLQVGEVNGGGELVATGSHPFWTRRGWVTAEELTVRDVLTDDAGRPVSIRAIALESRDARTFNLSVDGTHTFFVVAGETPVLVHNTDPWDILFTHGSVKPTFEHGPLAGRSLVEVAAEARSAGALPEGLELRAVRLGDGRWATLNNRTLMVARMADLPQVHPVDAGSGGFNKYVKNLTAGGLEGPVENATVRCK